MLKDIDWPNSRSYRTGTCNEPIQFYMDGLCQSQRFDLLLGYFSSSAINVLASSFAKFMYDGGSVRLVTNHILSKQDKEAIKKSVELSEVQKSLIDITDIKSLKQTLDEYGSHFFECLSWLIANKRIDLKVIKPNDGKGIAHYKSGAFFDGQNTAVFKASCNFTAYGLLENAEELECHLSWDLGSENRIKDQTEYFENIFSGKATYVDYLDIEDIQEAIKNEFGDKTIDELLVQEKDLLEKRRKSFANPKLKRKLEKIQEEIEEIGDRPRFPYSSGPRGYQIEAYNNWVANNYQGIFAMATGTGKTITALNCTLYEFKKDGFYHILILVPSRALLDQWEKEVNQFNFKNILKVGGGNTWEKEFANYCSNYRYGIKNDQIIIAINDTFASAKFQKYYKHIEADFLFIADEAHNLGSPTLQTILKKIRPNKRIGLSATPNRAYDPEGTDFLESFFHDKAPYTYEFSMAKALAEGRLTNYYYFPKAVYLDNDEQERYNKISKELLKFFDFERGVFKDNPIVEILLLNRKKIIHKAKDKLACFKEILKELRVQNKLKYVFTYVPEGSDDNSSDETKLIYKYISTADNFDSNLRLASYTSEGYGHTDTLKAFENGEIDIVFAMKMLDEGVDVPRTEVGVFASSTGNPRQYIQRRGRLLRTHKDKLFATIYDMIVLPHKSYDEDASLYTIERNLLKTELNRVAYFASLSMNFKDTKVALQDACDRYNLDIDSMIQELGL